MPRKNHRRLVPPAVGVRTQSAVDPRGDRNPESCSIRTTSQLAEWTDHGRRLDRKEPA